MVCPSQQINNLRIVSIGIFCLGPEVALIILEVYEPWKKLRLFCLRTALLFQLWCLKHWHFFCQHPQSDKTYTGNFCPKRFLTWIRWRDIRHSGTKWIMKSSPLPMQTPNHTTPFINWSSFTSSNFFCNLLPFLASIVRLFWSLPVLNVSDLIFAFSWLCHDQVILVCLLCLFVH